MGYSKALTMEMNSANPSTLKYSLFQEHSYKKKKKFKRGSAQ